MYSKLHPNFEFINKYFCILEQDGLNKSYGEREEGWSLIPGSVSGLSHSLMVVNRVQVTVRRCKCFRGKCHVY